MRPGHLPHGAMVEVRDRGLVGSAYPDVLARRCASLSSLHPRMLVASEQAREAALDRADADRTLESRPQKLQLPEEPGSLHAFNRLVDEDLPNRIALARLALAAERGDQVYISVQQYRRLRAMSVLTRPADRGASRRVVGGHAYGIAMSSMTTAQSACAASPAHAAEISSSRPSGRSPASEQIPSGFGDLQPGRLIAPIE